MLVDDLLRIVLLYTDYTVTRCLTSILPMEAYNAHTWELKYEVLCHHREGIDARRALALTPRYGDVYYAPPGEKLRGITTKRRPIRMGARIISHTEDSFTLIDRYSGSTTVTHWRTATLKGRPECVQTTTLPYVVTDASFHLNVDSLEVSTFTYLTDAGVLWCDAQSPVSDVVSFQVLHRGVLLTVDRTGECTLWHNVDGIWSHRSLGKVIRHFAWAANAVRIESRPEGVHIRYSYHDVTDVVHLSNTRVYVR